jgi:hypothetical protein
MAKPEGKNKTEKKFAFDSAACSLKTRPLQFSTLLSFRLALQFLENLDRFMQLRFRNRVLRQMVGLFGRGVSPSQGLYLHRITQHRKMRTNIHALSGIRTHNPSVQAIKTYALDRVATVMALFMLRALIS